MVLREPQGSGSLLALSLAAAKVQWTWLLMSLYYISRTFSKEWLMNALYLIVMEYFAKHTLVLPVGHFNFFEF